MAEPLARRYLNENEAAAYIGLCTRALRDLPIPVCRPNRRKLYDVKDLDSFMKGTKWLPSTSEGTQTGRSPRRSRQNSGSTAVSFRDGSFRYHLRVMPRTEFLRIKRFVRGGRRINSTVKAA